MSVPKEQSRAQLLIGNFAFKLAEIKDDVRFGDVWERAELSPRDRSLITVAALIAYGNTAQLPSHLNRARANGPLRNRTRRNHDPPGLLHRMTSGNIRHPVAKDVFKQ